MRWPLLLVAVLVAGCAQHGGAPARTEGAAAEDGIQVVHLSGHITYNQTAGVQACPAVRNVRAEAWGPRLNVSGARSLDVVLEWTPAHPVMRSLVFAWMQDPGATGASVQDEPRTQGPSPLRWTLGAAELASNGTLMVRGQDCSGEALEPAVAQDVHQDVAFTADATFARRA